MLSPSWHFHSHGALHSLHLYMAAKHSIHVRNRNCGVHIIALSCEGFFIINLHDIRTQRLTATSHGGVIAVKHTFDQAAHQEFEKQVPSCSPKQPNISLPIQP